MKNYDYIYKITNNINDKIYIGQKKSPILVEKYWGSGKLIKCAQEKYGIENFSREILQWCSTKEELNEYEIYFISKFNAQDPKIGYNIAPRGVLINQNKPLSEEHRRKIGEANKGRKASDELRHKLSVAHKGLQAGIKHPLYGKHFSEESRKLMSESQKGRKLSEETRRKMSASKQNMPDYMRKDISKRMQGNQVAKGRIWIHNTEISKMIYPIELNSYIELGFSKGRLRKKG